MKTPFLVVFALLCSAVLATAQVSPSCNECLYLRRQDKFTCYSTCTLNAECAGPNCCITDTARDFCYDGGCCSYVPGTGGVCYDRTGAICGNPFKCKVFQSPVSLKDTLDPNPSEDTRIPLNTFAWTQNEKFASDVGTHSPTFAAVIRAMQDIANSGDIVRMSDGVPGKFMLRPRPKFPVTVKFSEMAGKWSIQVDPADPKEGPHAPNFLWIVDNHWTLVSHDPVHMGTTRPNQLVVVAEGTF